VVVDASFVEKAKADPDVTYMNKIDGTKRLSRPAKAEREAAIQQNVEKAKAELERADAAAVSGVVGPSARPADRTAMWVWTIGGVGAAGLVAATVLIRRG
jgi:hypothetical protein